MRRMEKTDVRRHEIGSQRNNRWYDAHAENSNHEKVGSVQRYLKLTGPDFDILSL